MPKMWKINVAVYIIFIAGIILFYSPSPCIETLAHITLQFTLF